MVSCMDAATGKKLWRKDDFQAWPNFFVSSSPIIADGVAIAQLGGRGKGAIVAYDLGSGEAKWKWAEDGPAQASPAVTSVGGQKYVVAVTEKRLVAVNLADGKLAWAVPSPGRDNISS